MLADSQKIPCLPTLTRTISEKDHQHETNVHNFLTEASPEDEPILSTIVPSFHCWKAGKESVSNVKEIILSKAATLISLYAATLAIGWVIGQAKSLSLYL